MGIEPTTRFRRAAGFEDQEGHQTPIASLRRRALAASTVTPKDATIADPLRELDRIEIFQ